MPGSNNHNKVLLLHFSFWLLYFSYRVYDISQHIGFKKAVFYVSIPMSLNILASYIHYFAILPGWILKKNFSRYAIQLLLLLTFILTFRITTENLAFANLITNENYYKTVKLSRVVSTLWDTLSFLIFTGMIRFTLDWFDLENKKKQLENEKLVAELNYLKAQINPHFLFNTLHNLNYLVYSGSKKSTEVIIKLSNIMRYMIYDANRDKVPLKKEIEYMNDYVLLESIRLNEVFKITFDIKGNVHEQEISPLIMITFLENAFKHGVSDQEKDCWINVSLHVTDTSIEYKVSNKKINNSIQHKLKSGFGLENVKKRLQLSYPDAHDLKIIDADSVYQVSLTLTK
ncbi:sensor histidine kinase [Chryseosolibacter indicus]|uniref:Histidine kinase n=1 Tax=Chryseosolibacter indicus TaxID=2782351 RepID=A0ABS5VS15_9BACT|nr:histidine kinase [Chryseosolibacter indicus]MBT1703625.1 histidine kinase [Chryseosolibacter indicus]